MPMRVHRHQDGSGHAYPLASSLCKMRVLLVDDHSLFAEGLRNLLVSEGIQVVGTARDGFEALDEARRHCPDVILMDIQMPRCDGVMATRLIKSEMPECKIVVLTMSDDDRDLFDAVKSGASGYLLKHLDASNFFFYLQELYAGHAPFSPGLAEKILREFAHQTIRRDAPYSSNEAPATARDNQEEAELTARQLQILTFVAQGKPYREVAETIGISERTVKYHMGEIIERLHLQNRAQVIAYAAQIGLTRDD